MTRIVAATRSLLAGALLALPLALFGAPPAMAESGQSASQGAQVANIVSFTRSKVVVVAGPTRQTLVVEIAETPEQRSQGLMFRERMHPNAGMLFFFEEPQVVNMWMKNTLIPLDMIFLDEGGVIQHIVERTVPESLKPISSRERVVAVLEVNAGTALRLGLQVGDRVEHPQFGNARAY